MNPDDFMVRQAIIDGDLVLGDEAERLRLALIAVWAYARAPHNRMGEACGDDACIGCLIEATARDALQGQTTTLPGEVS